MTRSPSPIPVRPQWPARTSDGHYLERAAFAYARFAAMSSGERMRLNSSIARLCKELWPDDQTTPALVTRTASAPTTTSATAISPTVVGDFIASLADYSAAVKLAQRGVQVSLAGVNSVLIPRRQGGVPSESVAWVGEGNPIPLKNFILDDITHGPMKKLAVMSALTRETVVHASGQEVVATLLREDVAASLDASVFSNAAATADRPAGLLNGVTAINGATGGTEAAMFADLEALAAEIADAGGTSIVFVAHPRQAFSAALRLGRNSTITILPSAGLAAGQIMAIDPSAFAVSFGSEPRIDASNETAVHFEDTTPLAIGTVGTPNTIAAPTRSAWQQDLIILRCILDATWSLRHAGLVAVVNGATWGGGAS